MEVGPAFDLIEKLPPAPHGLHWRCFLCRAWRKSDNTWGTSGDVVCLVDDECVCHCPSTHHEGDHTSRIRVQGPNEDDWVDDW